MRFHPYRAVAGGARRFFAATGIPVPRFVRRTHRALRGVLTDDRPDLRKEVTSLRKEVKALRKEIEVLQQTVDRVEIGAYLDGVGRRPD